MFYNFGISAFQVILLILFFTGVGLHLYSFKGSKLTLGSVNLIFSWAYNYFLGVIPHFVVINLSIIWLSQGEIFLALPYLLLVGCTIWEHWLWANKVFNGSKNNFSFSYIIFIVCSFSYLLNYSIHSVSVGVIILTVWYFSGIIIFILSAVVLSLVFIAGKEHGSSRELLSVINPFFLNVLRAAAASAAITVLNNWIRGREAHSPEGLVPVAPVPPHQGGPRPPFMGGPVQGPGGPNNFFTGGTAPSGLWARWVAANLLGATVALLLLTLIGRAPTVPLAEPEVVPQAPTVEGPNTEEWSGRNIVEKPFNFPPFHPQTHRPNSTVSPEVGVCFLLILTFAIQFMCG